MRARCFFTTLFYSWAIAYYYYYDSLSSSSVVAAASAAATGSTSSSTTSRKLVIGVDGGTESIRACCFDAATGQVVGKACAVAYPTHHPQPGWAEQDPADWYESLGQAVRGAVASIHNDEEQENEICSICIDTTCCSVVALDVKYNPLRPCLLWMDQRSATQSQQILKKCHGDVALTINCNGHGPLSAEWMICKVLWINQNEPEVWKKAMTICEYQDYINYKLTGVMCASSCNAATRWHWNGEECIIQQHNGNHSNKYPGRPISLYNKLGIPELADKLPRKCLPMGTIIGRGLTKDAAQHLNLNKGLPVIQGGPDAFVGMIGLGCIHIGQVCLITGSSHLHCVVVPSTATSASGTWGPYHGAPLPGLQFAEGGQSSTGSLLRWARQSLFSSAATASDDNLLSYQHLDQEAAAISPGSDGLIVLETFQGSRTPVTDPLARGALLGLTLSHTRAHIWRALMEAVCFGTRACLEGLSANTTTEGNSSSNNEIILAGGITRSPLWLQMHADVTGRPVVVCENSDAPLLGCAILASVGVGLHKTVPDAVAAMVRTKLRIEPEPGAAKIYTQLYKYVYCQVADAVRPISHALHRWRGGGQEMARAVVDEEESHLTVGGIANTQANNNNVCIVSPSLLSADWGDMKAEVQRCVDAGATRLHVDIFDGVFLDSPHALTFGPKMVQAIRNSCRSRTSTTSEHTGDSPSPAVYLDLHVCVVSPERYVEVMAATGADCFIFQWEAMAISTASTADPINYNDRLQVSIQLAKRICESGMDCGISINPTTNVQDILPLLETGLVSVVDILAVEPGFGGQDFQPVALEKARFLRTWLNERGCDSDDARRQVDIMVDGGVNGDTANEIRSAGANILVSGSFLFGHPAGMQRGIETLLSSPST